MTGAPLFSADGEIHYYVIDGQRIGELSARLTPAERQARNERLAALWCHGRWTLASEFTPAPAAARRFKYSIKRGDHERNN